MQVHSLQTSVRISYQRQSLALLLIVFLALPLYGRGKDKANYGEGLIVNIPLSKSEVIQVVQDAVQNGIIRGSKEYNKDEFINGAVAASSSNAFPVWTDGGDIFYKVRTQALDPRNFKDSNDVGTVTVRYVVMPQGDANTVLRIDAIYVEDFRHIAHPSNGSVEAAEYKGIHEHLEAIEVMKKQTAEAEKERQEQLAKRQQLGLANSSTRIVLPDSPGNSSSNPASHPDSAPAVALNPSPAAAKTVGATLPPAQNLQQHVQELRHQVERLVKAPGAPLKSAPFHTASTLQSLPAGAEVLIVISTPYWFGVETHDGQHGWILRDQLELLP